MQIAGSVFATNIASVPARIPQVELRYGFLGRKRASGMVIVAREWRENFYGMYDIPPSETRDVSFDFWVYPPAPKPKEPEEFPYEITDPIEKEVVSVLKAELGRYQMCGRLVGGLSSVHIVYQGRAFTGVGGDSWTPDSPINQVIVADPEAASLKSDNLEAWSPSISGSPPIGSAPGLCRSCLTVRMLREVIFPSPISSSPCYSASGLSFPGASKSPPRSAHGRKQGFRTQQCPDALEWPLEISAS